MSLFDEKIPSSKIFDELASQFSDESAKKKQIDAVKAIFQITLKNGSDKNTWTIDLKNKGTVVKGAVNKPKPNCIITTDDETFQALASGKTSGQKAFMTGKLNVKGEIMKATALDKIFASANKAKSKL